MKSHPSLGILLILLGFILLGCGGVVTTPVTSALQVGDAAPAFTLKNALGGNVSLSDYKGKSVLLYFSMTDG